MNQQPMDTKATNAASIPASGRQVCVDKKIDSKARITTHFPNYFFQRLGAKEVIFEGVDFSYTIFDTCYLRKCVFQDCNFTGCRFTSSNFYGSSFSGCKFDYAVFERTIVDLEILDVGCPGPENLRSKFARSLRVNFQSLGDADGANKASKVELAATQEHYRKGWKSTESYYRRKYAGWSRIEMFLKWVNFKLWDLVWGNGESLWKLGRAIAFIWIFIAFTDVFLAGKDGFNATSYFGSFLHAPVVFFGIKYPREYPELYLATICAARLVMMGFLLSIIIKRFNRR
jgi:uncharacterized protein YjbI with pentapeptide repeats